MTAQELIQFEAEIAEEFNKGGIRAPVHLYDGNEEQMIRVFANIGPADWVLCSWRSHYQCLLKGVPAEALKQEIRAGRSISLCFPEYRILSSAIVTGVLPIALGLGMAIKRRGGTEKVFCFMGEMTSETGSAHECVKYARRHQLPIHWVVEDNGKSVCTDTRAVWNTEVLSFEGEPAEDVTYYKYTSRFPHAGAGVRVQF